MRPGLSGIGSIVFRNEESLITESLNPMEFYKLEIAPYKGSLEIWYVSNNSLINYIKIIYFTCLVVIRPDSKSFWHSFLYLPTPPKNIAEHIGFALD